ncbi:MAG: hypothetical protein K6F52_02245 [Clostridia bacterium]|nr:hypothetical protein [Clostridia bacterium]
MDATLTLKEMGMVLIGGGLVILIFYAICAMKNLAGTLKRTNKILDDTRVVTEIAANKAKDVEGAVDDVVEAVGIVTDGIKGNQSIVKALTNLINALSSLRSVVLPAESTEEKQQN